MLCSIRQLVAHISSGCPISLSQGAYSAAQRKLFTSRVQPDVITVGVIISDVIAVRKCLALGAASHDRFRMVIC